MRRFIVAVIRNDDLLSIIKNFCKTILSRNFNTACVNITHVLVIIKFMEIFCIFIISDLQNFNGVILCIIKQIYY